MFVKSLLFVFFIVGAFLVDQSFTQTVEGSNDVNLRPTIGILAQKLDNKWNEEYKKQYNSYIAASYVKFIESGGANVVPIWIGESESYYRDILSKTNGVLFPGGESSLTDKNGIADAGEIIYKIAKEFNDKGEYFPIWGTSLGVELLTHLEANRREYRVDCASEELMLPLEFTSDFRSSRMFKDAPDEVTKYLSEYPITANFHKKCLTILNIGYEGLTEEFHIISVNHDVNEKKFVSSLEHTKYPFYGVHFHPELYAYEKISDKNLSNVYKGIRANKYFADFFVEEARKSGHKFSDTEEENKNLIYNYNPTFTGKSGSNYVQSYLFE